MKESKLKTNIEYNFFYSGPLLFKTSLIKKDINIIKSLCKKNETKRCDEKLAGINCDQFNIDSDKYNQIIEKYLDAHAIAFENWYGEKMATKLKTKVSWVNYMRAGSSNPTHVHENCKFSSVLFLELPKNYDEEVKFFKGTASAPGFIVFDFGCISDLSIYKKCFKPKVGDLFIFPWNLTHSVNPFSSKGERISVAANFE